MKLSTSLVAFALATIIAVSPTRASNLVVNGEFEAGDLTGWTCSQVSACFVTNSFTHTGSFAIGLVQNFGFSTLTQTISTIPGVTYDFSVWSMTNTSLALGTDTLEYSLEPPDTEVGYGFAPTIPLTTAFAETTATFIASGPSTAITFYFATQPGAGDLFIDDVSVTAETAATPLPAALALFVTGLGALGLLGWRKRKAQAV